MTAEIGFSWKNYKVNKVVVAMTVHNAAETLLKTLEILTSHNIKSNKTGEIKGVEHNHIKRLPQKIELCNYQS